MAASEINKELAGMFATMARVLDIKGGGFRAISFNKVSRLLDEMTTDVKSVHADGGEKALAGINGVGKSSAKIIADVLDQGRSVDYDELVASVPPGVLAMLDIPGMGPKTVAAVWQEKGIETIDGLAAGIADGSLEGIKGLGRKKLDQIAQGIDLLAKGNERRTLGHAIKTAEPILARLRELPGVIRAETAGSLRRGKETVGDLDFLAVADDPGATLAAFAEFPEVGRVLVKGESKCSIVTASGLQVDCRVVPDANFGAALQYFTGSKEHNTRLRAMALSRGHTLNEWGIYEKAAWDKADKKPGRPPTLESVVGPEEKDVYAWFDLPWIAPELREDRGELDGDGLPDLIEPRDYRGDLHCHTTASDGTASILDMAQAAKALGYKFLAITDHSKSQFQANGLDAGRLLAHVAAVREANEAIKGIELLAGSEVDILSDGSLDYDDAVLAELDWVVASPHVALRQESKKATDRILRAIDSPFVNAIGHPTGRLINQRVGLPLDIASVVARASETGTALEINASYQRLDLSDTHARMAVDAGGVLTVNTDAHSTSGLSALNGGLAVARRAWASKKDVLNCWTLSKLRAFVAAKRP
jgi:DNA polymerase (family 10)